MFCKHCGKQIDDSVNACPFCGTGVTKKPSTVTSAPVLTIQQPEPKKGKKQKQKKGKKTALKVIAVILVIAILAGGGYFAWVKFFKKDKNHEEKLREILAESTTKPVIEFVYEDYDADGTYEAYAVVGTEEKSSEDEKPEYIQADIYYVNEKEAQVIKENVSGQSNSTISANDRTYISLEVDVEDDSYSYVYTVDSAKPAESEISGQYSEVHQEKDKVVARQDDSDAFIEIEVPEEVYEIGHGDNEINAKRELVPPTRDEINADVLKNVRNASVGDIVNFGSYPQSRVTDSSLISSLEANTLDWYSYDYYTGTGVWDCGEMIASNYMKFADVTYGGEMYRAVSFSQSRPHMTGNKSSAQTSQQDDNGYISEKTYWFKYEPLEWQVLDPEKGFVVTKKVIDSQSYTNIIYGKGESFYGNSEFDFYANDYSKSAIREWLNKDFYNTAFSSSEQSKIISTECTNNTVDATYNETRETTNDKVFLLSYDIMVNGRYGLTSDYSRQSQGTDYAKCQGLEDVGGYSWWWLRTPDCGYGRAYTVDNSGAVANHYTPNCDVGCTLTGVKPALCLNLDGVESDRPEGVPADAKEFNGHYYKAYNETRSWTDAKAYCETSGGHLVTITSQEENDFVTSLITGFSPATYSIGTSDAETEGEWKWITGETFEYSNWGSVQPDNLESIDGQHYGKICNSYDPSSQCYAGQWDDIRAEDMRCFICEWE